MNGRVLEAVPTPLAAPSRKRGLRPPWPKGVSGNPSGHSGLFGETVRLAREASPDAMRRLIALVHSDDERVATVAINAVLDRAWGKPKEAKPDEQQERPVVDLSKLSEEHKRLLLEMFRSGVLKVGGE